MRTSAREVLTWRAATGTWRLPAHPDEVGCACTREIRELHAVHRSIVCFVPQPTSTEPVFWRLFLPEWAATASMDAGQCVSQVGAFSCRTGRQVQIWGMPGAVAKEGLADRVLPLGSIAVEITRYAEHREKRELTWKLG